MTLNNEVLYSLFELQGKLYMCMEICRAFDQTFKEHLDGMYVSDRASAFMFLLEDL